MRIQYLDLIRYGCFTDVRVNLSLAGPDIHILVGPNEAGKSTVKAALEDLLFGIPNQSKLNFVHQYKDMRLGAVLEANGDRLSFRRRKGKRDTILDGEDTPLPSGEQALKPFLGNSSRGRFERMFSLDHERLRQGGQEILDAKGDLGEALYAASSGFQDLRGLGKSLEEEAGEMWSRRKSGRRRYYQAEDRLREAEREIRQHTVQVQKWRELRDEVDARTKDHSELGTTIGTIDRELRRLRRIRRVARPLREKARLDGDLREMGEVAPLPDGARETLQRAEEEERIAAHGGKQRQKDLVRARDDRNLLEWDEPLLLRADDIDQLHRSRIQVQTSRSDLPKREAELSAVIDRMRDLASDLGWTDGPVDDLVARIPDRPAVTHARRLLNDRADRLAQVGAARKALAEAEERRADIEARLGGAGTAADTSRLRSVLSATGQDSSGVPADIRAARQAFEEAEAEAQALFERLRPGPESVEAAVSLPFPSEAEVKPHLDERKRLDRELDRIADRIRSAESDLSDARRARDRIAADERPVGQQEVSEFRAKRDTGWQLVRRKYIEGDDLREDEIQTFTAPHSSLAWAYEKAVESADTAADRWGKTANAAARLDQARRNVEALVESLGALQKERAAVEEGRNVADRNWRALWGSVPFQPVPTESALAWLAVNEQIRKAVAERNRSQRKLASLRRQESAACEAVLAELETLGVDATGLREAGLLSILERGREERERLDQEAQTRTNLETDAKRASVAVQAKRRELEAEEASLLAWQVEWSRSVAALGFPEESKPEYVQARIDVIESLRQEASEMTNLRDKRVELIRRDIEAFEQSVGTLVGSAAPDLARWNADEAAIEMERRLANSRDAHKEAMAKDRQIRDLEAEIRAYEQQRAKARESVIALQQTAGVNGIDDLRLAIEKAERARGIERERARILQDLSEDGDGLPIEEMEDECRDADLDEAASRETELTTQIDELRDRQVEARDRLRDAEKRFDEIGGSGAAAAAEGARQDALAEIREVAQQYIQKRTAALLLQWSVERNRLRRQGPMLRRAGKLFAELTMGSFEGLELDFDTDDRARLVGRRPSGERVDTDGMSSGSADQLYLALRVAALENYAGESGPLPFVADDLFVNFDDRRSAAGFRVLARLASKYQVIFLTHHAHLAEVAELALDGKVHVWRFPTRTGEAAAKDPS